MAAPQILSPGKRLLLEQPDKLFSAFIDRHRYSALGALVEGIVHNLNGSLQILSMHIELLQGTLAKEAYQTNQAIHDRMEKCLGHLDHLREMLEILMRKGSQADDDVPQTIRLNDLLEEEISLLGHNLFFKHQVKVEKVLSSKLPLLRGNYKHFSEGLFSFIQNAIEAMEGSPEKVLTLMTENKNGHLLVTIRDTGCGISEEILPYLFKPFFTTKGKKHYGLGLFVARELLTPYGASFHYASREGETLFSVGFPLKADQVPGP